ncbi:MAG: hypothetical protein E7199_06510 [Schwartzia succinivorans]|nr:hypothetical protein [Schwartzia succinivorans]
MAKATKNTKAMTTIKDTTSALTTGFGALNKLDDNFTEEMNGLSAVFDRIKIPIGGVTYFEMPTDDLEKTETVKEFSAVILHQHAMRAYYKEKYTGGNNPPDCGSLDGMVGNGAPGGVCDRCVCNQFGSGENGSKACKERRRLYLLQEGEVFPKILSLPTGSLKEFARYLMHCLPNYGRSCAVLTRFSLTKAINKGGIAFSKAQFRMERPLTETELAAIEPLIEQVKIISKEIIIDEPMDDVPSETVPPNVENAGENKSAA